MFHRAYRCKGCHIVMTGRKVVYLAHVVYEFHSLTGFAQQGL